MTQKERVLRLLQEAGEQGVRSDRFYREFNGRGVARIYDLRKEGYGITDEREGKYKRYFLIAGVGAGKHGVGTSSPSVDPSDGSAGDEPQEAHSPRRLGVARSVPSMFDCGEHLSWGGSA